MCNVIILSICQNIFFSAAFLPLPMNINTVAAHADLSAYADWTVAATLSADGNEIVLNGTTLELPAFGIAVLIPNA